jgi:glycosyltransferase involved in cell wall biosynthesis
MFAQMRVAILQSGVQGFFPRFYKSLSDAVKKKGDSISLFVPNSGVNRHAALSDKILWGGRLNWHFHYYMYKLTGLQDIWSVLSTIDLIVKLKKFSPDIINFHVINDNNLCFPLLLKYINKYNIPLVWTFHDLRAITGRCAYFEEVKCLKWQNGCNCCNSHNPWMTNSLIDNASIVWQMRKKWFTSINRLTIIAPSKWLANYVDKSFFKDNKCEVINNGIDVSVFSKVYGKCPSRITGIVGKVVLGVAAVWNKSKGVDTMRWLAEKLGSGYFVVIVGNVESNTTADAPANFICLPLTKDIEELVSLYQRADVFVNPTMSDNFPTVNIEALAAGTPVVTYDTGGSAECLVDNCGIAVEKGDRLSLLTAVKEICDNPNVFSRANCIERSKKYSLSQFDKYVELYHSMANL